MLRQRNACPMPYTGKYDYFIFNSMRKKHNTLLFVNNFHLNVSGLVRNSLL